VKIANIGGRPYLITSASTAQPIMNAPDVLTALTQPASLTLGSTVQFSGSTVQFSADQLEAPLTTSQQIFAIGMNFLDHSEEIHIKLPTVPSVFTKFSSSLAKPTATVRMHGPKTDWETDLVVVIGLWWPQYS